tara:strand:+ start:251 stop:1309 length:1059 start_codon:yes stop_codon:yes gene_type:complete
MNINNVSVKNVILILFFFLSINAQEKKYAVNTVAFYNVENLFDTVDDPTNTWDEARTPDGEDRWTEKKYQIKLNNLAKVLPQIGSEFTNQHPAILGLCEVENRQVLIDLISTEKMKDLNYGIIHFDSKDWRGIDVALLFDTTKFIPRSAKTYPLKVDYKGSPSFSRDVLVVFGFLNKEPINFIVNHWPSRGGGQPSIAQRYKAGELNRKIIDSIMDINPMSKIITMGDFNDNPDDPSIKIALKTESEIEKVTSSVLYNPMEVLYTKKYYWTNYYQGAGYMLDQLIVSGSLLDDNSKLKYLKAGVFNKRWLINGKDKGRWKGYPTKSMVYNRFDPKGYSDHLPVFLYLASEID